MAWLGGARQGNTSPHGTGTIFGGAQQGAEGHGEAGLDKATRHPHGTRGNFRRGSARPVRARRGTAEQGAAGQCNTSDVNGITSHFRSNKNQDRA